MKKIGLLVVAALFIVSATSPVSAHEDSNNVNTQEYMSEMQESSAADSNKTSEANKEKTHDDIEQKKQEMQARIMSHKEAVQAKREELRQRMQQKRDEIKTKLANKRLELCKKRQEHINALITSSAQVARERLKHIQAVEKNVTEFYEQQQLSSTEYPAVKKMIDEKEANAIATIEVIETSKFECSQVDGENPAGEIKTMHQSKVQALNEYRDSVKQLIQILKATFKAKTTEGSAS